ncbi:MAG: hypothetical protein JSU73_13845 [candidate division WOR-3 bacterium]|nr:MAG: hypothetical protein JSU73_13845 [candidate division WOR-3 bacterium]
MKCSRSWTSPALVFVALTALAAADWVTTGVDTLAHAPGRRWLGIQAIVIDNHGRLHACWSEAIETGRRRIVYTWKHPDSAWAVPEEVTDSAGSSPALAVEPSTGQPHIAFHWPADPQAELHYARRTGQDWTIARLTQNSLYDVSPSISLEPDGSVHIAWVTKDSTDEFRIGYATDRSGDWQTQVLLGSEPGPFGTGAAPYMAVEQDGKAHVSYRGGDFGNYQIHHAENESAGDSSWTFEQLSTVNLEDYSSAIACGNSGELRLVASGNDGWGMPFRTCYLRRAAGSSTWDPYQLMTASASAEMRGFCLDQGDVHVAWERINGSIATGNIWHCTNESGLWFNSALREDDQTHYAAIAVDHWHKGHCLAVSGPGLDSQYVLCIHSEPLTGMESLRPRPVPGPLLVPSLARSPVRFENPGIDIYALDGRLVHRGTGPVWDGTDLQARVLPQGTYIARLGPLSQAFVLTR